MLGLLRPPTANSCYATQMLNFIEGFRRRWLEASIIDVGSRLRELRAARSGIDAAAWPQDAAAFDVEITALERRHEALLAKFRKEN